ncbi:oligosaccharide flippase family protein [Kocuria koreensis]|uniref:Oligosaccharide flippase family protein n=1 Tax=Rothia koreensis TaxID=592378 RepID=A0A7K1LK71_9MICC|nr:oligosaccharide flippase family protein [Rothia koreensis]MUN55525.1 oligosaccharide flippase family protein [Rothia koreensis]
MSEPESVEGPVQGPSTKTESANRPTSMGSGLFYSLLSNLLAPVAGLAIAPILSNGLGEAGRGALGGVTSIVLVASSAGAFGMPEALTFFAARYVRRHRSVLRLALWTLLSLGALCALAVWALSPFLSSGHGEEYRELLLLTSVALVPNMLILIPRAFVAATNQWKFQALEQGLFSVLRLVALVALLGTGHLTVLTAVIVTLASPVLGALVYLPVLWGQRARGDLLSREEPQRVGEMWAYGSKVWLGSLSGIVLSRIDQTVMIRLTTLEQQGLYAVAVTIGEIPSVLSNAFRNVVFAADAADTGDDATSEHADRRLTAMARITVMLTVLTSVPIAATSFLWVGPIFGAEFSSSIPMLLVLLAAAVVGAPGSVAGAGLSGRGRPDLRSRSMAIGAVFNLAVLFGLTSVLGGMGAALSTLVGNAVAGNLNIYYLRRHFGFSFGAFYAVSRGDAMMLAKAAGKILRRMGVTR